MHLEVIESSDKCVEEVVPAMARGDSISGCTEFMVGCCVVHFWCWEDGQGLCC